MGGITMVGVSTTRSRVPVPLRPFVCMVPRRCGWCECRMGCWKVAPCWVMLFLGRPELVILVVWQGQETPKNLAALELQGCSEQVCQWSWWRMHHDCSTCPQRNKGWIRPKLRDFRGKVDPFFRLLFRRGGVRQVNGHHMNRYPRP